jgi:hypothetical protein
MRLICLLGLTFASLKVGRQRNLSADLLFGVLDPLQLLTGVQDYT